MQWGWLGKDGGWDKVAEEMLLWMLLLLFYENGKMNKFHNLKPEKRRTCEEIPEIPEF